MLWSAVSLGFALVAAPQTLAPLPTSLLDMQTVERRMVKVAGPDRAAWNRIAPSVVTLIGEGRPTGAAVLISTEGLFLAHITSVPTRGMDARLSDGRVVRLNLVALDEPTQLALLQAPEWREPLRPVEPEDGVPRPNDPLIAVLPGSVTRAQYVTGDRFGVVRESRRFMPLAEIRMEVSESLGGALLFARDGRLVGVVAATLGVEQSMKTDAVGQQNLRAMQGIPAAAVVQYGPSPMGVAYSVAPNVVRRVFAGFRSPSRVVVHPSVGIFCADQPDVGALITSVVPGSPAERGGLRVGDVIVDISGTPIRNQFAFARLMAKQQVGNKLVFRVRRDGRNVLVDVTVGG